MKRSLFLRLRLSAFRNWLLTVLATNKYERSLAVGVERSNERKMRLGTVSQATTPSAAPPIAVLCIQNAPADDAALVDERKRHCSQQWRS